MGQVWFEILMGECIIFYKSAILKSCQISLFRINYHSSPSSYFFLFSFIFDLYLILTPNS